MIYVTKHMWMWSLALKISFCAVLTPHDEMTSGEWHRHCDLALGNNWPDHTSEEDHLLPGQGWLWETETSERETKTSIGGQGASYYIWIAECLCVPNFCYTVSADSHCLWVSMILKPFMKFFFSFLLSLCVSSFCSRGTKKKLRLPSSKYRKWANKLQSEKSSLKPI